MSVASLKSLRHAVAVSLLAVGFVGEAIARDPIAPVNTENGVAVKGYDPVAYFRVGEPVRGKAEFSAIYEGATYRFASAEDRQFFVTSPGRYVPQYGGYCAFAMALNRIADIDPEEWAIVGDKLYLNNGFFAQRFWSIDKSGNIERADRNWPNMPKLGVRAG
jgi:YHS domain-containing protein